VRVTRESRGAVPAAHEPTGRSGRVGRRGLVVLAAVAVAALGAGVIVLATRDSPRPLDRTEAGTIASGVVDNAMKDLRAEPASSVAVYQQILPSIVAIETERATPSGHGGGLGTGVVVNANGTIMTAFHVVDGAARIRVTFVDGTRGRADVVQADPDNDTAVLVPTRLPEVVVPAVLGGGVQVGDETYAVGHPLGYADSITAGVVSGLDRSVKEGGKTLRGLIQFDAAVNPGNSGGPLLNRGGQVIGIVTALANPGRSDAFVGLGFAVPIGGVGGGMGLSK
jgi:S1-C subfamily serine protease